MTAKPELISFSLCPFVQRAVILLREKGVDFDIRYIDLANKPDWFLEISPRGKVPVLVTDGTPLFESMAICEYLEDTIAKDPTRPADPVALARDRAWWAVASEDVFGPQFRMMIAKDQDGIDAARKPIDTAFERLEEEMGGRQYLSGDGTRFGFADVAFAPALMRFAVFADKFKVDVLDGRPNLQAWSQRVLARAAVRGSVRDDFLEDMVGYMKRYESKLAA